MRRLFRAIGYGLSSIALALFVLAGATARTGDPALWPPKPGEAATDIFVVSHGYHSGIAVSTAQLAAAAQRSGNLALGLISERFGGYPFIEVGWGEQDFYASVPTVSDFRIGLAVRALFGAGNNTVLHVVGLPESPRSVFASADIVRIELSEAGLARMMSALNRSFALDGQPAGLQVLGRGLYGPSLFIRANGNFSMFNVCNHWVADMLSAAGLPVTPVLDTVPPGLMLDLKLRAGLSRMPGLQQ
ncbi:DUF2459 domain-containing protein [Pseudorhodoplanes sp.]|uniref:DUF2459 domain-containing protein n=1 Tax=Pseudorhodoplanes sp. TaxID=1934341 RepID=UPI002C24E3B3|nr:DUF2459 domain-containing protein [Pseudorhodoplanes sp.]HWV54067.1 DUF2459 domain-containing protein [Pseudorhodoplanes sp.]